MAAVDRRLWLARAAGTLVGIGLGPIAIRGLAQSSERLIKVRVKKFTYDPEVIMLKRGEPVVLEFMSLDVNMGFKCSDLGLRADITPEKATQLRLTPDKAGRFEFHCDVFCGDDHESMTGTIAVAD
jgi:cytochrome c oxidase subunit II